MPKMVMKSFGKRNFMQPMGRPKHALQAPCFFSFYVLGCGVGERCFFIFLDFPMCSHYVPFKFPMGSQYFPQHFFHTSSLLYALENGVLLSPIWVAKRGGIIQFKIKSSVLGSLHYFIFFGVMGQSN